MFKKRYFIAMLLILTILISGCSSKSSATSENDKKSSDAKNNDTQVITDKDKNTSKPIVTIEMEDGAKIKLELYPAIAPNTVNNFISLIQKGFYNGLNFHRVIPGFMIQGGDPLGNGQGGPGYGIKGEFTSNGFTNDLKHTRGVISMARTSVDKDSAGSQFFIMVKDGANLDGDYASFGKVIEGIEEVDKIVSVQRNASDKPLKDEKMKSVTVDTLGVKYGDVIKAK